jgi:hypothetical protein
VDPQSLHRNRGQDPPVPNLSTHLRPLGERLQLNFCNRILWTHEALTQLQAIVLLATQIAPSVPSTRALFTSLTFEQVCKLHPTMQNDNRLHGDVMEEVMSSIADPPPTPSAPPSSMWDSDNPCPSRPSQTSPKPVATHPSAQMTDRYTARPAKRDFQGLRTPPPRSPLHHTVGGRNPLRTAAIRQSPNGLHDIIPTGASIGQPSQEYGRLAQSALAIPPRPPAWTGGWPHQAPGRPEGTPLKAPLPPRGEVIVSGGYLEGDLPSQSCQKCRTHLVSNAVACPKCGLAVPQRPLCQTCAQQGPTSVHCTFCSVETPAQYRSFETCAFCAVKRGSSVGQHCEGCGDRTDHKRLKSEHTTGRLESKSGGLYSYHGMTAQSAPIPKMNPAPIFASLSLSKESPSATNYAVSPIRQLAGQPLKLERQASTSSQNGPVSLSWMMPLEICDTTENALATECAIGRVQRWVQAEGFKFSVTCPTARVTHRGGICLKRTQASIPKLDDLMTKASGLLGSHDDTLHLTIRKLDARSSQDPLDGPMERKTIVFVLRGHATLSLRALRPEGMTDIKTTIMASGQAICIPGEDLGEGAKISIEAYGDEEVITVEARSVLHSTEAAKPCENARCTFGDACAFGHNTMKAQR